MKRFLAAFVIVTVACQAEAWKSLGHQLVAQIALDNLNPQAKQLCVHYNQAMNQTAKTRGLVQASTWLDTIRYKKDVHWYDALHYIDIPFSKDGTLLPPTPEPNALWAIHQAMAVLTSDKASAEDKGLSLRILMHTVGDIHQPLHTAALVSHQLPQGDMGGNLFRLGRNSIANNLHSYWDKGAGALAGHSTAFQIRNKAHQLETRWSCKLANHKTKPEQWIQASHQLARSNSYNIDPGSIPSKKYQLNAQNISQKQIFFAGCRLALLLNTLA